MADKSRTVAMVEKAMADKASSRMPERAMSESESDEMPTGGMLDGNSGAGRFRPPDLPPGAPAPDSFEEGVVEIQFRERVRPQIVSSLADSSSEIASPSDVDLAVLNQILQRYRLGRAEPSLQTSEEEATEAQGAFQDAGDALPNLRSFVTLHFSPDADTRKIALELSRLPEIERAVAVLRAIPPWARLHVSQCPAGGCAGRPFRCCGQREVIADCIERHETRQVSERLKITHRRLHLHAHQKSAHFAARINSLSC